MVSVEKKIDKVVTGAVTRRKASLGSRLKETFIGGDAKSVGQHILASIIIPTLKDSIADIGIAAIERTLFGEERRPGRRGVSGIAAGTAYTAYNKIAQSAREQQQTNALAAAKIRNNYAFDDIGIASRAEAELVIDRLIGMIGKYEQASVGDLFSLLGLPGSPVDENYGWCDIHGMGVDYVRGEYLLCLPKPVLLKQA